MPDLPRPLAPLLDAWSDLSAVAGRRSLSAAGALVAGTAEQREPVALALLALGYPEAMASAHALGATLRALRGLRDTAGRYLDGSAISGGAMVWYVRR